MLIKSAACAARMRVRAAFSNPGRICSYVIKGTREHRLSHTP